MPEIKKYLNRDGLEEYNSLLPHSSAEMQTYVNDWLDEHPEATTTVQDGAITEPKLADKSVTRNKLAGDIEHLLGGMMLTREDVGESLNITDAYTVSPISVLFDGKSVQNGEPTPSNPVPIENIEAENLQLKFSPKNVLPEYESTLLWTTANGFVTSGANNAKTFYFGENEPFTVSFDITESIPSSTQNRLYVTNAGTFFDLSEKIGHFVIHGVATEDGIGGVSLNRNFIGDGNRGAYVRNIQIEGGSIETNFSPYFEEITTNIPMLGNILAYLNAKIYDKLTLNNIGYSNNNGIYNVVLTKMTGYVDLGTIDWIPNNVGNAAEKWGGVISNLDANVGARNIKCSAYTPRDAIGINGILAPDSIATRSSSSAHSFYVTDSRYMPSNVTAEQFKEVVAGTKFLYRLSSAYVEDISLGEITIPAFPANGVIVSVVPETKIYLTYMRDANIVISDIEEAIADQ